MQLKAINDSLMDFSAGYAGFLASVKNLAMSSQSNNEGALLLLSFFLYLGLLFSIGLPCLPVHEFHG